MIPVRSIFTAVLLISFSLTTHAQFNKWINKAKEKALEKVTGKKADTTAAHPQADSSATASPANGVPADAGSDQPAAAEGKEDTKNQMAPPKPIAFKHTGTTVKSIHGVFAPVIDGDIDRVIATPQGKYFFDLARQKGLKGSNTEVFRQLISSANQQLVEEIDEAVKKKFPEKAGDNGSAGSGSTASDDGGRKGFNPAWGGVSAPSLYFEFMMGSFDTWVTGRYIKATLRHDHFTMADVFGVNAASIFDLDKHLGYAIGSVLGVNFTKVDTLQNIYSTLSLVKKDYLSVPGIRIEKGKAGRFGDYNTVSERIVVPVRPYTEKESGRRSDGLLRMHDILANREDSYAEPGQQHYDPNYQLVFEYYFTHDLDKYLPKSVTALQTGMLGSEGQCIGAELKDENGNSAVWRLIDVQTDQDIDEGEFQVPVDYPVMTHEQLRQAIRAKMGVHK